MTTVREPLLKPVAILDLRPTQITVGMREVKAKRKRWRDEGTKKGQEFLGKHMIPVILGPKGRHYVIDHHHLARALHDEGVEDVAITVIENLSVLDRDAFWFVMDNRDWTHPFDADGRRGSVVRRDWSGDPPIWSPSINSTALGESLEREIVMHRVDELVEASMVLVLHDWDLYRAAKAKR